MSCEPQLDGFPGFKTVALHVWERGCMTATVRRQDSSGGVGSFGHFLIYRSQRRLPTDFEAKEVRQQYVGPCKTCLDRCAMLEQHSLSFGYVHDNFLHYMTKRNRCRLLNQNIQSKGKSRARFYSPVLQVGLTFLFCDAIMQAIRGLKGR